MIDLCPRSIKEVDGKQTLRCWTTHEFSNIPPLPNAIGQNQQVRMILQNLVMNSSWVSTRCQRHSETIFTLSTDHLYLSVKHCWNYWLEQVAADRGVIDVGKKLKYLFQYCHMRRRREFALCLIFKETHQSPTVYSNFSKEMNFLSQDWFSLW